MNEIEEIRCIVSGTVQGVLYRNFVAEYARHLALVGYVRNTPDSTVEVVAQGYHDKLEEFIGHLHKGTFLSRVSDVDVEWHAPSQRFQSFNIKGS
ncbi:MAG: Acylphosphatase [Candidatus Kaiserbacteria bacterium GW2011_GWB1_52_6]|uniref:acylphosphatase n=1 Tax=Candidatus Kaiserbacteria bacterium GW2011_GWB1_52_6 TaxID=1618674 RepID=A0A0G1X674_9BACT|nr:MAG: Acylphosphatase [Candidatus Kaiserbacteria bacterium GW2011_GWB1_52_6]